MIKGMIKGRGNEGLTNDASDNSNGAPELIVILSFLLSFHRDDRAMRSS
jgi:hypothetical protein